MIRDKQVARSNLPLPSFGPSLPQAFGTGSDDSSCRLFDMRCYGEANYFGNDKVCLVLCCVEICVVVQRLCSVLWKSVDRYGGDEMYDTI